MQHDPVLSLLLSGGRALLSCRLPPALAVNVHNEYTALRLRFSVLIPHFLIDVITDEVTAGKINFKNETRMTASVLKQDPIT